MKVTREVVRSSIVNNWTKSSLEKGFNPSEASYYLFDTLYRGLKHDPRLMKELYRTLIELNHKENNVAMVKHLREKESDFFKGQIDKGYYHE